MGRANQGSWRPGQTGNPNGRPRVGSGLAQYARTKTKSGRELVDHALRVLRGEARTVKVELYQGEPVELAVHPSFADQEAARKWLADRAFGRALEAKEMPEEPEQKPKQGEAGKVIDIRPPEVT
jgi:hypothetical protein